MMNQTLTIHCEHNEDSPYNRDPYNRDSYNRVTTKTVQSFYEDYVVGVPYYKVKRVQRGWMAFANISKKWTQTDNSMAKYDMNICEYWQNGTLYPPILQVEINRVIDLYQLTGARDLNIDHAISDLFQTFQNLPMDQNTKEMLLRKISKSITYRKYYSRKKFESLKTGKTMQQVLKREK